MKEITSQMASY